MELSPLQPPEAKTRSVRVRSFCRSRRLGWLMVSNVKRFTTERMLITFHSYDKYIIYCWILNARLLRTINFICFHVNLYHYDVYIHTYPLSDPIEVEVTHTKEETKHPTSRSYPEDFSSRKTCGTCLKIYKFFDGGNVTFPTPPKNAEATWTFFVGWTQKVNCCNMRWNRTHQ